MSPRRVVPTILALALVSAGCGSESASLDAPTTVDPTSTTGPGVPESTSVVTSATTPADPAPGPTTVPGVRPAPPATAATTEPTGEPTSEDTVDASLPTLTASDLVSDWVAANPLPLDLGESREVPDLGVELYLHEAEPYTGGWLSREIEHLDDEFPAEVLWGNPELDDPFSDGDFALEAYYDPHVDDYHVVDASNEISFETQIAGRTAQVTPWVVSQFADESVGFRIFWDADPDHYVGAASRTMTLEEMGEVLQTITFDDDGASIDNERFGLEPIPIRWEPYYFAGDDYFSLKTGFYTEFDIDELAEDGEYGEVNFWLIDGDIDDIMVHRFLAASEQVVSVRGTTGYVLEGLNLWSDYPHTALIWQEKPGVIGLMDVDEPIFGPLLVELADRTDVTRLG